uniref:Uncharacterized protein n=1 Tax=Panagrolaimus sp. ES5 TaxID=591445 RepID=A0AC34F579_9BILA
MEAWKDEIVSPFEIECKFNKANLIVLKESENRRVDGKCFYAFNIPGLQYYIEIFPNGHDDEFRGQTWIFLHVNGSNERKITAEVSLSIESADCLESFNYVYDECDGYGYTCCKTVDFFDSNNNFFVNGEVTIKAEGIFKVERPSTSKILYPISMQWKIKEKVLKSQSKLKNGSLCSKSIMVASFDAQYYLAIVPNKIKNGEEPEANIYFFIEMGKKNKKIEAVYDFSIDSVNYNRCMQYTFEKSKGFGPFLCSAEDLFNPAKGYFVGGCLTINLNGILMIDNPQLIVLDKKCRFKELRFAEYVFNDQDCEFKEIVCPIDIECKFKKSDLFALKDSEGGFLNGKYFYAQNIPGLRYYIRICPKMKDEKRSEQTKIFFTVDGLNGRKITTKITIIAKSTDDSTEYFNNVFEKWARHSFAICKTAEFFDPKNKFFIDGEITIKW